MALQALGNGPRAREGNQVTKQQHTEVKHAAGNITNVCALMSEQS